MSVTATASSVGFSGDGVADEFPIPFRVLEDDDLLVRTTDDDGETYTTLVLDTDYSLAGTGPDDGTGTAEEVTLTLLGGALDVGTDLVIERNTDLDQETTYQPQGTFSPITVSRMSDKLTLIVQELERRIAELESLADLVTVTDLADGVVVSTAEISVLDPVESMFPITVACVGGSGAIQALWHVRTDSVPPDPFIEPPQVDWYAGPGANEVTINHISGLDPNEVSSITVDGLVILG